MTPMEKQDWHITLLCGENISKTVAARGRESANVEDLQSKKEKDVEQNFLSVILDFR